jgi:hypothetical protein
MFGFLLLVAVILIITCSETTILLCYFHLAAEDYNWWWRSFMTSGFTAVYFFVYAAHYYQSKVSFCLNLCEKKVWKIIHNNALCLASLGPQVRPLAVAECHENYCLWNLSHPKIHIRSTQFFGQCYITINSKIDSKVKKYFSLKTKVDNLKLILTAILKSPHRFKNITKSFLVFGFPMTV